MALLKNRSFFSYQGISSFEADWTHFESKGLSWFSIITGEKVNDGELTKFGGSNLENGLGFQVRLFRLKQQS